jgi:hypothetical protein
MGETAPDTGQHQIPRESVTISLQWRKFEDANAFDFEIAMRWDSKEGFMHKSTIPCTLKSPHTSPSIPTGTDTHHP